MVGGGEGVVVLMAKRGRPAGRVESDRGGCDAEAPASLRLPAAAALSCRWVDELCRHAESESIARAETRKRVVRHFLDRTMPSTQLSTTGGDLGLSAFLLHVRIGYHLGCYGYHPTTLSSTSFFGYSRTPHTATDKNTPNDTDLQSNHQIANTTTFAFSQPRTTPTSTLLGT